MSFPGMDVRPVMPEDHNPAAWSRRPAPGSGVFVPPESSEDTRSGEPAGALRRALGRLLGRNGEPNRRPPHTFRA